VSAVKYRAIVADPPWHYDSWPASMPGSQSEKAAIRRGETVNTRLRKPLPYASLSVPEIAALPVQGLADPEGCHVYMWTTNRYLRDAFTVFEAWGVRYGQTLVWAKTPMGLGPGGTFAQSAEFILFGRIGTLRHLRRVDSVWFNWPRMDRAHSRKPDAFLDLVETVSPGPYLEMFSRRSRLGWDTHGDQSLGDVQIGAA
jgi:N6-adenosine-specific RNA methylase IME4